ncbi:DUF1223 domain-containing protein [Aquimarina addita]|uniref:DUF1223 domain-containing protein n=1 Tax=Aquimarina addita TaxID=870485 RepID=A0ABP6UHE0_9FLAO
MIQHLLTLLTLIISITGIAQDDDNAVIVMELFTSQGCSSCPPADDLLEEIKDTYKNDQVFVLSYHVDYWNRLGWKDPFSQTVFSDYQREYAQKFDSRSMYTPQLVVNGSEHFSGSDSVKVQNALQRYAGIDAVNEIYLTNVEKESTSIALEYLVKGDEFARLTLALVISERITKIGRGENRNKTLKNTNIVAARLVETKKSGGVLLGIPDWMNDTDELSVIGYTQDTTMKVTGAFKIEL